MGFEIFKNIIFLFVVQLMFSIKDIFGNANVITMKGDIP